MILVVDDLPEMARVYALALRDADYEVDIAHSGEEALQKLRERFYDVMLLDLVMPGIGGQGVLQRYRAVSPQTAVIILTAYDDQVSADMAVNTDVVRFLKKSELDMPDDLLAAVEPYARVFKRGGFSVDVRNQTAVYGGVEFAGELTPTEFNLLAVFVRHRRVSFEQMAAHLRPEDNLRGRDAYRAFNAHLSRLREKLQAVTGYEVIKLDTKGEGEYILVDRPLRK